MEKRRLSLTFAHRYVKCVFRENFVQKEYLADIMAILDNYIINEIENIPDKV